ncbi:hypothetical protein ACT3SP_07395 [Brachybacterium sp. AOP43-C2-M15]|uniref:hypothetical protein n=1 Tax=Brachybacterium sp. AOP43-C2-M15 TaxID=3457661 RepID=UPI0040344F2A
MQRRGEPAPETPGPEHGSAGAEGPTRGPSRRQLLRGAGGLAALGLLGTGTVTAARGLRPDVDPRTVIPLWSGTVAYDDAEQRVLVGGRAADIPLSPGSRLAEGLGARSPARSRAEEFRAGTTAWRAGLHDRFGDGSALLGLADSALQDLWVLGDDLPAPVAGWSGSWRFVWPRDAAFCAAALARIGHVERAVSALEHLQSLQAADGWFEARYVPGTARAPDRRRRQFDGTGLLLWACDEVVDAADPARRGELLDRLAPLITRSLSALHSGTRGGAGLPPVSPDYWEVHERTATLGLMAATLTGLRAGARLTDSSQAQEAASTFTVLLEGTFGRSGYQRYRGGGGADSALALLDATGCSGPVAPEQLLALRRELARPGGGIAPGASWRDDGVSWTPSTSLLGLALARIGEQGAAREVLVWLAGHRTEAGSLPEKVLFDGRPAEVAPLAWTAANVLLTLDSLARA